MTDLPVYNMTSPNHVHQWVMWADVVPNETGDGGHVQTRIKCDGQGCVAIKDVEDRPAPTRRISEDEFFEEFHPDNNGGNFYNFLSVNRLDPHYVWTIVESGHDNNLYALPGFQKVNKIDYVVCTKPWTDDIIEAVYLERGKQD